jgi:hypothetical protein
VAPGLWFLMPGCPLAGTPALASCTQIKQLLVFIWILETKQKTSNLCKVPFQKDCVGVSRTFQE